MPVPRRIDDEKGLWAMTPVLNEPTAAVGQRTVIVIPARLASTRLARKMLLDETGKPLIQHTYEAACCSRLAERVVVATDSVEIERVVRGFGGEVRLTDPSHPSGTDRIAEVVSSLPDYDVILNLQGDEPEMPAEVLDAVIGGLLAHPAAAVATAACPIREEALLHDPSCVKVVMDGEGRALYFSRSPIPYPRLWDPAWLTSDSPRFWQHIGLYAYRRDFLLGYSQLPPAVTEQTESLEQLRVLHAGLAIQVIPVDHRGKGIDTPTDYAAFVTRQRGV